MVGRMMPKDIGIAQGGLPVVEATGEIQLLEPNLLAESGFHLSEELIVQCAVARYVVAEEMMSQIYQPLQITRGLLKVLRYLPSEDWIATVDAVSDLTAEHLVGGYALDLAVQVIKCQINGGSEV